MKIILLTFPLLLFAIVSHAQSSSLLIGGNIEYTSTKQDGGQSTTHYTAGAPYIGYQLDDHFTAGIASNFGRFKTSDLSNQFISSSFQAGPFLRYTKKLTSIFSYYVQAQGLFGSGKLHSVDQGIPSTNLKVKVGSSTVFPAVMIHLKHSLALNFNIGGIGYETQRYNDGSPTRSVNIKFGKALSAGISKNFGGK